MHPPIWIRFTNSLIRAGTFSSGGCRVNSEGEGDGKLVATCLRFLGAEAGFLREGDFFFVVDGIMWQVVWQVGILF